MVKKYSKEQLWKIYQKLPQELKDVLFAEETSDNIYDICKRNDILDNLNQIVELVGEVLIGVLPPSEFEETLKEELKLNKGIAKKVAQEVYRFIFFPVKTSLEEIYKIGVLGASLEAIKAKPSKKPPTSPKIIDKYREPIE